MCVCCLRGEELPGLVVWLWDEQWKHFLFYYICLTGWPILATPRHIVLVSSWQCKQFPTYFTDGFPELQISPVPGLCSESSLRYHYSSSLDFPRSSLSPEGWARVLICGEFAASLLLQLLLEECLAKALEAEPWTWPPLSESRTQRLSLCPGFPSCS